MIFIRQMSMSRHRANVICSFAVIFATALLLSSCVPQSNPPHPTPVVAGTATVYIWDVGEALSILIDDEETEILIDAGNDRDGAVLVDKIAPYVGDGTIEYVIATHSHADHIGGFEDIYAAYHVAGTIYGDTSKTGQFTEFMDAAQGEEDSSVKKDEDEVIDLLNGATLTILDILDGASNTNNNSVISVFAVGSHRMLITGDAEDEEMKSLQTALVNRIQSDGFFPIDVYVVGHHGSETSSSDALLSLIRPTYAVVSSEGTSGRYHNPAISVMERLTTANARIYATYRSGDITVTFDKNGVRLSPPDSELLTLNNYRDAA